LRMSPPNAKPLLRRFDHLNFRSWGRLYGITKTRKYENTKEKREQNSTSDQTRLLLTLHGLFRD
jgi:hypothetical protein